MATTQDYCLQTQFKCMKLKLKMSMKILATIKKCLILVIYSTESKYYDDSNELFISKMKDETAGVAIQEFVGLKPKIYPFLAKEFGKEFKVKIIEQEQQINKILFALF